MTTIIQAALSAPPTCDAKTRMFDSARDGVPYCRVTVALKSLIDASGNRRWYCHAPGHRGLVVRSFGEFAAAVFDGPEDWESRKARMDAEMEADLELMADEFHGSIR